jgi:hypothetical protein
LGIQKWATGRTIEGCTTKGTGGLFTDLATLEWAEQDIIPPALGDVMKNAKFYSVPPVIVNYRPIVQKYVEKALLNEITAEEFITQSGAEIEEMVKQQAP